MRSKSTTRAETVRARRREEKQPRRRPRRAATLAASTPVVVSRYGVIGGAVAPAPQSMRKRVTVARGRTTETVAVLPAFFTGWRAVSFIISLLALLGLVILWYAPFLRVHSVRVANTTYVPKAKIAAALAVEGRPVVGLDPKVLEGMLLRRFPSLAAAHVKVGLSDTISVQVRERQPVLVWQLGKQTLWLSKDGMAFTPPVARPPKGLALPKVQADTLPDGAHKVRRGLWRMLKPSQVRQLRVLASFLPKGTALAYHRRYGFGWRAPQGWQVFVGQNVSDMDKKLAVYDAIASWLEANGIKPALVSVESLQAPYYRMEP